MNCSPESALPEPFVGLGLQPYPDISGIGVLVGFMGSAYLTLAIMLVKYLVDYDPSEPPFEKAHSQSDSQSKLFSNWKPNPVDRAFLDACQPLRQWLRSGTEQEFVTDFFDDSIIGMCDIQIMSGFAILISAFANVQGSSSQPPLSSYHWLIASSLAWFSSVTHLSGLVILRTYYKKYPAYIIQARVLLMFLLLVMTSVALIPTGFCNWDGAQAQEIEPGGSVQLAKSAAIPQSPAGCYLSIDRAMGLWDAGCYINVTRSREPDYPIFGCNIISGSQATDMGLHIVHEAGDTSAMQQMGFMVFILDFSFIIRCFKLLWIILRRPNDSSDTTKRSSTKRDDKKLFKQSIGDSNSPRTKTPFDVDLGSFTEWLKKKTGLDMKFAAPAIFHLIIRPLSSLLVAPYFITAMITSMLTEMLFITSTLVWGTVKLLRSRNDPLISPQISEYENAWTFGQIMAVVVVVSPILSAGFRFAAKYEAANSGKQDKICEKCRMENNNAVLSNSRTRAPESSDKEEPLKWGWPCIVAGYLMIAGLIEELFRWGNNTAARGPEVILSEFWLSNNYMLAYLLLAYPMAMVASIVLIRRLGEEEFKVDKRLEPWKKAGLVFLSITIHVLYFLNYVDVGFPIFLMTGSWEYELPRTNSGHPTSSPRVRITATMVTTALLYGTYALGYGLQAIFKLMFRNPSW